MVRIDLKDGKNKMKNIIGLFFLLISTIGFSEEIKVKERMIGFLKEATNKTIQSNIPYIKYLHTDTFFPAPEELYDQVIIEYKIESISSFNSSSFSYCELDKDLIYRIEVAFKKIGNIEKNSFKPLSNNLTITYYWGYYNNEWFIIDIKASIQMIYTSESYVKWLTNKKPTNYTETIENIKINENKILLEVKD